MADGTIHGTTVDGMEAHITLMAGTMTSAADLLPGYILLGIMLADLQFVQALDLPLISECHAQAPTPDLPRLTLLDRGIYQGLAP